MNRKNKSQKQGSPTGGKSTPGSTIGKAKGKTTLGSFADQIFALQRTESQGRGKLVAEFGQLHGNRHVQRLIQASQRSTADPGIQRTPEEEIIDDHTAFANLSEDDLALALLRRLPEESAFVSRVLDTLGSSDRDDVSFYMSNLASDDRLREIGSSGGGRRLLMRMVSELQSGSTDDEDAVEIERLIRLSSPSHERLRNESWSDSDTVTEALDNSNSTLQSINSGSGDFIYDEYSVIIDAMPEELTAEEYLGEMASDLNRAVNDWWFDAINEFQRTNSTPEPEVGDIYGINIGGPDNGSVMLVDQGSNYFIFQTVTTSSQGTHPEYGSREFGFEQRSDGSVKFYTRGASRPGSWVVGVAGRTPQAMGWTRMMRGISDAIASRGGTPRPDSFRNWTSHRD